MQKGKKNDLNTKTERFSLGELGQGMQFNNPGGQSISLLPSVLFSMKCERKSIRALGKFK